MISIKIGPQLNSLQQSFHETLFLNGSSVTRDVEKSIRLVFQVCPLCVVPGANNCLFALCTQRARCWSSEFYGHACPYDRIRYANI